MYTITVIAMLSPNAKSMKPQQAQLMSHVSYQESIVPIVATYTPGVPWRAS